MRVQLVAAVAHGYAVPGTWTHPVVYGGLPAVTALTSRVTGLWVLPVVLVVLVVAVVVTRFRR